MSVLASSFAAPTTSLRAKRAAAARPRTAAVTSAKALDVKLAPPTTRVPPRVPEGRGWRNIGFLGFFTSHAHIHLSRRSARVALHNEPTSAIAPHVWIPRLLPRLAWRRVVAPPSLLKCLWDFVIDDLLRVLFYLLGIPFAAGAPVVPPQELVSRPRRNRRSATVREAFREVRSFVPRQSMDPRLWCSRCEDTYTFRAPLSLTMIFFFSSSFFLADDASNHWCRVPVLHSSKRAATNNPPTSSPPPPRPDSLSSLDDSNAADHFDSLQLHLPHLRPRRRGGHPHQLHARVGSHSLPGVRLVTWTIPAVIE
jgi:hypothetical protein